VSDRNKERWRISVSMLFVAIVGAPLAGAVTSLALVLNLPVLDILKFYIPTGMTLGAIGGAICVLYYSIRKKIDALDALLVGTAIIFFPFAIAFIIESIRYPESMNVFNLMVYATLGFPASVVFGGLPAVMLYFVWAKITDWLGYRGLAGSDTPLAALPKAAGQEPEK
jgi:hypothetical protein